MAYATASCHSVSWQTAGKARATYSGLTMPLDSVMLRGQKLWGDGSSTLTRPRRGQAAQWTEETACAKATG